MKKWEKWTKWKKNKNDKNEKTKMKNNEKTKMKKKEDERKKKHEFSWGFLCGTIVYYVKRSVLVLYIYRGVKFTL